MLLDCAKLGHWRVEAQFDALFTFKRDYESGSTCGYEDPDTIGALEPEWNDFDQPERQDQDDPQHPAQDPALEERPAGRLHPGRDASGCSRRSAG